MKQYLRERERDAKTSTGAGVLLTVGVHLLILLCCAFTGMKYLYPPPPEETFLIDFEQEEEIEIRRELQGRQPQAEEIDLSKPVELVQRSESPHKSDKPAKTAQAKPDSHGDVETPAPKEDINKNALFPGMSKKDSSNAPHSASDPSAGFKAGHPKGNTSNGKADGVPNARLKGRNVLGALPKSGNVTKALAGAQGTTVSNPTLWAAARVAAMKTHFNQSVDAPELQQGTITYIFKLK